MLGLMLYQEQQIRWLMSMTMAMTMMYVFQLVLLVLLVVTMKGDDFGDPLHSPELPSPFQAPSSTDVSTSPHVPACHTLLSGQNPSSTEPHWRQFRPIGKHSQDSPDLREVFDEKETIHETAAAFLQVWPPLQDRDDDAEEFSERLGLAGTPWCRWECAE